MSRRGVTGRFVVGFSIASLLVGCGGSATSSPPPPGTPSPLAPTSAPTAMPTPAATSAMTPASPSAAPASGTPSPSSASTILLTGLSVRGFGVGWGPVTQAYFAVDPAGNVYLPGGTDGAALVKIAPDGHVVAQWAGLEVVKGQTDTIVGVAVDPKTGDVWATDASADKVVRLTPDLAVSASWGSTGPGRGQFSGPGGIALDGNGNVVVADMGNDRVETFSPGGTVVGVLDAPGGTTAPVDVTSNPGGDLYVSTVQSVTATYPSGQVLALGPDGKVTRTVAPPAGSNFLYPDAAVDSVGNVWIADASQGLLEYDSTGTQVGSWAILGGGNSAVSARVAPSGDVYTLACGSGNWDCWLAEFRPGGRLVANWRASTPVSHAGAMVEVGDHDLYLQCVGSGSPTILYEAGYSDSGWIDTAQYLMGRLSPTSRFCAYDRRGQGFSDPNPADDFLHWSQTVSDLHTLLTKARVSGPYVITGYSFGGLLARLYAYTYPSEVTGLVLVDPGSEDQFAGPGSPGPLNITTCTDSSCPVYSDIQAVHALTHGKIAGSLGALPLVVVSHSPTLPFNPAETDAYFLKLGDQAATASSNSVHVVASWSSHPILFSQPGLVTEAVRQVVAAARASNHKLPACGTAFTQLGGVCK
jgi:pimeloyl-ACP methyl ester carboxylesterase